LVYGCNSRIQVIFKNYNTPLVNAIDFSADVFIEDNETVTAVELKSVKPNSGEMRGEKLKILEGKAALYRNFPNKKIMFFIGFPFDPTVNPLKEPVTGYNKKRFLNSIINMNKYFDFDESLIASELWDFLSGQTKTMEQILYIINTIATTSFLDKFQYLNNNNNRNNTEYLEILNEWFLYSEIYLIKNKEDILKSIIGNTNLTRLYNKKPFDSKGNYNFDRYNILKSLLKNN